MAPVAGEEQHVSEKFPCTIEIRVALPTHRLAHAALTAIQVDAELSPLVQRDFALAAADENITNGHSAMTALSDGKDGNNRVLVTTYRATTNRMLRVAVNGFFESLLLVLQCMQELDIDTLPITTHLQDVQGAQGVEYGMIGPTV